MLSQLRATFKLNDTHPHKSFLSALTLSTTIEIGGAVLVAVRCRVQTGQWGPMENQPFH